MAGLRCGVLHTWNKQLIESLRYILYMCAVPVMIQDKLTCLLSDTGDICLVFLDMQQQFTCCVLCVVWE